MSWDLPGSLTPLDIKRMERWGDELKWFRHHGFETRPECAHCHFAQWVGDDFKHVNCSKMGLRDAEDWCIHFKLFNSTEHEKEKNKYV